MVVVPMVVLLLQLIVTIMRISHRKCGHDAGDDHGGDN